MNKYKKICLLLFTIFSFFVYVNVVNAESLTISGGSEVIVNQKITLKISYTSDVEDPGTPDLQIRWDKNLLKCTKNCQENYTSKSLSIDIEFTALISGSTNVTAVLDGHKQENKSITIKPTPTSSTTTTTTTKASSTTTTTTALDKTKNANLKSLKLLDSEGNNVSFTPTFNANTYTYSANVDGKISRISVQAVAEQDKASISNNNSSYELSVGTTNKIPITVTAEDGITKKTYTVNVFRESLGTDATLKSLVIKEASDMDFVKNKYSYKITVNSSVKKLNITYKPSSEDSKVTIEGNKNLKDGSVVKIIVKAPDDTKKEYTITVNMKKVTTTKNVSKVKAQKNPLIIMGLSLIAFGLIGGILYVIKK